jgi:N-acetyl-gamma-glutamyl-phosphate reductase
MIMNKIKVGIVGITGYTGEELLKILSKHPGVKITALMGRQASAARPLSRVYPSLSHLPLIIEGLDVQKLAQKASVVFLALPHRVSFEIVPELMAEGIKVIDLSADFRLNDGAIYEVWYKEKHTATHLLSSAAYGLPEYYRADIAKASLVANPGCYPTSIVLGLMPALKSGMLDAESIIVDSKSGISGAGRKKTEEFFKNESGNFRPYNIGGGHRHIPEIEQELSKIAGKKLTITFTPHIIPIERGMLSVIYADLAKDVTTEVFQELYAQSYANEPFVRVLPQGAIPEVRNVINTNTCEIGVKVDARVNRLIIVSAIDNLVKGAAGQAVENMNIMFNIDERMGLVK